MMRKLSLSLVVLVACGGVPRDPNYPVTQVGRFTMAANARARGSAPDVARGVTADRLLRARDEPQNWLTYYGAYDGQRYSALSEISTSTIKNLRVAWVFQQAPVGVMAGFAAFSLQAAPIVVDGVMYMTGPDGWVWALDGATGQLLWQHQHPISLDMPLCCGSTNRGAAVADGKVFVAFANGHLAALDGATGHVVWESVFADARAGESSTGAPLVVRNVVIVGTAGAEFGVRGHIDGFDARTGKRVWRRYNIPAPGEPGASTWPANTDAWARGGGTSWITGTFDADANLVYWGIANPGPLFDAEVRPGDNLYTNSLVAFRPEDGSLVWHFQFTPHDQWDYDAVSEMVLIDRDGRKLLTHFDKNGHYYVFDREARTLIRARPFARVTWGTVDSLTGRVTAVLRTPSDSGTVICPGGAGAKEWSHTAYSPRTGLVYVPVVEQCGRFSKQREEFREGLPYWGGTPSPVKTEHWGYVKAIEPVSGREVWSHRTEWPMVASMLATAGDVVFTGEPTGEFEAFDARNGALLWRFQTGSGIHSNPVTYSVNGKQYVAVASGWGGWTKGFAPGLAASSRGDALFVFALP